MSHRSVEGVEHRKVEGVEVFHRIVEVLKEGRKEGSGVCRRQCVRCNVYCGVWCVWCGGCGYMHNAET